jgi:hypothetical protein
VNDWKLSEAEFEAFAQAAKNDRENIRRFSTLLELSTGQAFALPESELEAVEPAAYVDVLRRRIARVDASIDGELIERTVVQYELQVRSQHHYRLQRYDRPVHLYCAEGTESGLIAAHLRPYVPRLHARSLPMAPHSEHDRELLESFSSGLRTHYSCMRNDLFARSLASEIDAALVAVTVTR